MESSLSSIFGFGCGYDGPKFTLSGSFVITSDPHSFTGIIVGNTEVLLLLYVSDSDHGSFLLEYESLVGCTVETVHDERAVVHFVLGDVESFGASSMNWVEDVVLFGFELGVLDETHAVVVAFVCLRGDRVGLLDLGFPVFEWFLLFGRSLFVHCVDNPNLAACLIDIKLEHIFAFLCVSSIDIKHLSSVCSDEVSFVGIGTLLSPNDIEPAACMFPGINDDLSSGVSLVLEDAKPSFSFFANNSKLIVLRDYFELLINSVFVLGNNQFVLFGDCEDQSFVEDGVDSVRMFWIGVELGFNIRNNFFLPSLFVVLFVVFLGFLLLLSEGFDQPKLVLVLMDVVLKYLLSIFCFSSADVKSLVACVGFDEIGFVAPFSFLSSCQGEPAAVVLSLIGNDLDSVILLVLENAEATITSSTHQG